MNIFSFKQFQIQQEFSAMKVGTDGVLLGAWVVAVEGMKNALDIGSGTGLLSLMLAQRFPNLQITGVEIEKEAVLESRQNVARSPWADRVVVEQKDFTEFKLGCYDLIVSNPPFFSTKGNTGTASRTLARHEESLPFKILFAKVAKLLSSNGQFSLIYPKDREQEVLGLAVDNMLYTQRKTIVYPMPNKASKRILQTFSLYEPKEIIEQSLIIETGKRHSYTEEYYRLTKDFYLFNKK